MSRENVEGVQRAWQVFLETGEIMPDAVHDDVVVHWNPDIPGSQIYHGPEGLARALREWQDSWEGTEYEFTEMTDAGDHVLVGFKETARGRGGVSTTREWFQVYTFREGKLSIATPQLARFPESGGVGGGCDDPKRSRITRNLGEDPMRLFIDTGSVAEVEEIARWGILAGATTNPSLLAKEEGDPGDIIRRICELVGGPTSAEVVSEDAAGMAAEGRALRELHEHVIVKVPFCEAGLAATRELTDDGIPVNMTLVFSPSQALLAASAGATYVSCFMGRLDDISVDSAAVVAEIVDCFRAGGITSQIIAASIRHPEHVITASRLSCEIATVPAKVLRQMLAHPLTASGSAQFKADWETRPEFGEWLRELTAHRASAAIR